jgi:hypothetical protein
MSSNLPRRLTGSQGSATTSATPFAIQPATEAEVSRRRNKIFAMREEVTARTEGRINDRSAHANAGKIEELRANIAVEESALLQMGITMSPAGNTSNAVRRPLM